MDGIKKPKNKLIVGFGLLLIIIAFTIWLISIIEIKSNEIILATQNLSVEEFEFYQGSLQWWNNIYNNSILPIGGILVLTGLATSLSPQIPIIIKKVRSNEPNSINVDGKSFQKRFRAKEKPMLILKNLIDEEIVLKKKKRKLSSFSKKLQLRVEKEIISKKNNIKQLKTEINDLKSICEELSKSHPS